MDSPHAVLTGDLVKSTNLSADERETAMAALRDAYEDVAQWEGGHERVSWDEFRGDGWQALLLQAAYSLRACLYLRASLRVHGRHLETRISVGIGGTTLSPSGLSASSGTAFELSGRGLDGLRKRRYLTIAGEDMEISHVGALFGLCDHISQRWTPAQCRVLKPALAVEPMDQVSIAKSLGMSPASVSKHLRTAGEAECTEACRSLESSLLG